MRTRLAGLAAAFLFAAPLLAGTPPAPRDVTIVAADGAKLKATYYPAAKPGPAIVLLHMCNSNRAAWAPLAPKLAAAGFHALALDYRGFGESAGQRFLEMAPQDRQQMVAQQWPADVDAAYAFLSSQPGVDKSRVGAAGGSCGVNQAVLFARRHPEVRSLALLAGEPNADGLRFLRETAWLPLFAAAADDDGDAPETMRWLLALSGNPRNTLSHFKDGGHGTEIFGPHPELVTQIAEWFTRTLVTDVADPAKSVAPVRTASHEFWTLAADPATVARAVAIYKDVKKKGSSTIVFPQGPMNVLGYQHLQAGDAKAAIALFELNTEVFPRSANTWDSLGDAYLAAGEKELALAASRKAIDLLATDTVNEEFKNGIRASAEKKIAEITAEK